MVLEQLEVSEGDESLRELSERIAERESGQHPAPRDVRRSVYVSLQQTHLPKLDDLGIVDYDDTDQVVGLDHNAAELNVYMEVVPRYGISWGEYYAGVALVGLASVLATFVGVPGLAAVPAWLWATGTLVVVLASGVYQVVSQQASIFHRLADRD